MAKPVEEKPKGKLVRRTITEEYLEPEDRQEEDLDDDLDDLDDSDDGNDEPSPRRSKRK